MQILLQGPLSYAPAPRVGKRAGLCPVLVTAKGCLQGLQFSGSPRWPQLVELWKCSRLFHLATEEANWLLQDQIYPIQGSEVSWVNFSRFLFEGICFTSQLMLGPESLIIIYFPEYFIGYIFSVFFCIHYPLQRKNSVQVCHHSWGLLPFPCDLRMSWDFCLVLKCIFVKNPSVYVHFHN